MTKPIPPSAAALYLSGQNENATLRQLAGAWLAHLDAQGYSPRSLEGYRERLLPFVTWCEERGLLYAPQVSLEALESYQRHLRGYRKADGQPLVVGGQLSRLSAIRNFWRWLLKRHVILYNPADLLELPKGESRLPAQVFSEGETRQVLQSLDTEKPLGLRNRAILEMFWSTGIRRMELANLRLRDVDVTRGVLNVRQGKGKKDRVVPVGDEALAWVQRYLKDVRPRLAERMDSGHLFLTQKGDGLKRATLTMIGGKAIREQARVNKPGACHIFRHSMATQMLENGADTRHIQAILGHEKLETTQVYTRVAIGALQRVHDRTHPAEKRRRKAAQQPETPEQNGSGESSDSPKR
ncbi:site-specific tyrosine recombinase XerC [Salmonella enterica]|nr:site-specific tyrosine recombinase XerC [Salmonella enterica]